jgi:hypothetical protein
MANLTADKIDAATVVSVYSGKHGCACGCLGKHTYATKFAQEESLQRGYAVTVSDKTVNLIVGKMNALLAEGCPKMGDASFISVETTTRLYIAYLKQGE